MRDVPDGRFATASALNAAFGQVGAVPGTALPIAIVGEPVGLVEALSAADDAHLFAVIAALASGAVTLVLRPALTSPHPQTSDHPRPGAGRLLPGHDAA